MVDGEMAEVCWPNDGVFAFLSENQCCKESPSQQGNLRLLSKAWRQVSHTAFQYAFMQIHDQGASAFKIQGT
jgi:hypothetical protein